MTPKQMGHRLKALRNDRDLSRQALAEKAGISREYVRLLEAGRYDPTVGMLQRLAKALGVPLSYLLGPGERGRTMDFFDVASSALEPGQRLCVPCWARAARLTSPKDQQRLRAFAQALLSMDDPTAEKGGSCDKCGHTVEGLVVRARPLQLATRY